jgi:glycolate oxidase iron-sulfur subunit
MVLRARRRHGSVDVEPPLALDEDALVACVACGLCLPHCPTYRVSGLEVASPRGRIAAMRGVQLEGADWDGAFADAMETCVQCRGCEAACPSSVPFGMLMEGTRAAMQAMPPRARSGTRRIAEWLAYRVVLPHRAPLYATGWTAALGRRLRLVPRRFGIPRIPAASLGRRLRLARGGGDAWLFLGCVMRVWHRDVHRAASTVMTAAGARPMRPAPGAVCCGALHEHAGRRSEAHELARKVIAAMPGDAPVVVDSAGCGAAMKDYGRWLGTNEARAFSERVRDFAEWAAETGVPALRDTGTVVVIQDPCHLRHVQHAAGPTRELLAAGYRLLETDDDGLCCGAGGVYAVGQPALATAIRDRKIAAIRAVAGDAAFIVASANPGCAMHLAAGGVAVAHPAELAAAALESNSRE